MNAEKINIRELESVVCEWTRDANLSVSVWDKGTYGRVYVNSHGKRKYSGYVDTDGKIDFFWAYFTQTHRLNSDALIVLAAERNITLHEV